MPEEYGWAQPPIDLRKQPQPFPQGADLWRQGYQALPPEYRAALATGGFVMGIPDELRDKAMRQAAHLQGMNIPEDASFGEVLSNVVAPDGKPWFKQGTAMAADVLSSPWNLAPVVGMAKAAPAVARTARAAETIDPARRGFLGSALKAAAGVGAAGLGAGALARGPEAAAAAKAALFTVPEFKTIEEALSAGSRIKELMDKANAARVGRLDAIRSKFWPSGMGPDLTPETINKIAPEYYDWPRLFWEGLPPGEAEELVRLSAGLTQKPVSKFGYGMWSRPLDVPETLEQAYQKAFWEAAGSNQSNNPFRVRDVHEPGYQTQFAGPGWGGSEKISGIEDWQDMMAYVRKLHGRSPASAPKAPAEGWGRVGTMHPETQQSFAARQVDRFEWSPREKLGGPPARIFWPGEK